MTKIQKKIVTLSYELISLPKGKSKHFTFICNKNKIVSIGWNDLKTHTRATEFHPYYHIHSELMALIRCPTRLDHYTIYNTRINTNGLVLAKPCRYCQCMLKFYGASYVYYTDYGIFKKLVL